MIQPQISNLIKKWIAGVVGFHLFPAFFNGFVKGKLYKISGQFLIDFPDLLLRQLRFVSDQLIHGHIKKCCDLRQKKQIRQALPRFP